MRSLSLRRRKLQRGTSLVELLVVIVVFLIGILAVAQIFPGGFRVLAGTRARSLATTVARAEAERLKARPDLVPEAIMPVRLENAGTVQTIVYGERSPNDYAPVAARIDATGNALDSTNGVIGKWGQISGANTTRRIVGETHRVGAPRFLSPVADPAAGFGGLVTLQFGPISFDPTQASTLAVYGRDMFRRTGLIPTSPIDAPREYEYILVDPNATNQTTNPARLVLPAAIPVVGDPLPNAWRYGLSIAVYLNTGGMIVRREVELTNFISVPPDPTGFRAYDVAAIPGVVPGGSTLVGVERDSVRIARAFLRVDLPDTFSNDPYEYRVVNPFLGTLLFNPAGYNRFEQRPGESRRPFAARVNYNVYDWRVLREDFRIPRERYDAGAVTMPVSVRLAVSPLRATDDLGADGIRPEPIENLAANQIPPANRVASMDHFVLLDLETGGVYFESYNGRRLMDVNKSTGRVKFQPYNTSGAMTGWLRLWNGTDVEVPLANRAVRAFYVGKDEWAVQVLRAPARYSRLIPTPGTPRPVPGTFVLGPDLPETSIVKSQRIYFPVSDTGRKVSIGRIAYTVGGTRRTVEGGDFVIRDRNDDPFDLPCVDLVDVLGTPPGLVQLDMTAEIPAAMVRGASVVVRVFHNDAKFNIAPAGIDLSVSGNPFDRYLRQWRVDVKETYLDGGEPLQ